VLRRFETYRFGPNVSEEARSRLRAAFRDSSRSMPEVLWSATGQIADDGPVQLVWEHAYASAADYRRYMEHPFHASVLDRYLLADSPERIVVDSDLGIGLAGYACAGDEFHIPSGRRHLIFLDLRSAHPDEVAAVADLARRAAGGGASVFAANTLAAAWFDGETPVGPAPRWSHLWERGFPDPGPPGRAPEGGPDVAGADGRAFEELPGVAASLTLTYRIEPGWGYTSARGSPP
jgi:hypothetical protein